MLGHQDSFVQLLTSQFDSIHGSTSFFHPNMWNQTCLPQHMNVPNEDIPIRVDDTHNVNDEHEDVEANTEYDSNCCVRNDLDKNETKRSGSDEDIWYDIDENDDDGNKPTFMIMECGLVTLHLITTMKQT